MSFMTVKIQVEKRSDSPFSDVSDSEELCNVVCDICKHFFAHKPDQIDRASFAVVITDDEVMFIPFKQFEEVGMAPAFIHGIVEHKKATALAIAAVGTEVNVPSPKGADEESFMEAMKAIDAKECYKVVGGFRDTDPYARTFELIMEGKTIKTLVEKDDKHKSQNEAKGIFKRFFEST